jgi:hypothetical protein
MSALATGGILWLIIVIFGIVLAIAWIILPFALIGTKPLLRDGPTRGFNLSGVAG